MSVTSRTTQGDRRVSRPIAQAVDQSGASDFGFHSLPAREIKRRCWHMMPGLLAIVLQFFPHRDPISPTLRGIIVGCIAVIAGWIFIGFRQIQRREEGRGSAAVAGYSMSVLLTTLLFPRHLELGLSVLMILAFGDGSATVFGLLFRGRRLPWNSGKSWSGFVAFIGIGCLTTALIYWSESHNLEAADPAVSFATALALTAPAVVLSALAESLRSRWNDNVRVGIVASLSLLATHTLR